MITEDDRQALKRHVLDYFEEDYERNRDMPDQFWEDMTERRVGMTREGSVALREGETDVFFQKHYLLLQAEACELAAFALREAAKSL